jgi:hypothetical protein
MLESLSDQAKELSSVRTEVGALAEAVGLLHDDIQDLEASAATPATDQRSAAAATTAAPAPTPAAPQDTTVAIRMIPTHADTFADKLKHATAAQDGETFPDVFGRYLQLNGVNTSSLTGLYFDERTGRVIVRGGRGVLDQIEQLTTALDQAQ